MPEIESEHELVLRAQQALSRCNWEIGECAALWTKRHAKGRTDADFGALIGLSGDQVFQRRRVWETFSDVQSRYEQLKWSHYYAALNWDDAAECLKWADDMQATVAEMKAWRRAQRGEDLAAPSHEDNGRDELIPFESGFVRDPSDEPPSASTGRRAGDLRDTERPTRAAAARDSHADDYAPFGNSARGAAPSETMTAGRPEPALDSILKRVATALERCDAALTPDVLEAFAAAPVKLRRRLLTAVEKVASKTAGLRV